MTGGDSLTEDLNVYYNAGDIAWMITATALVLLMIPGVGSVLNALWTRFSPITDAPITASSTLALLGASPRSRSFGSLSRPPLSSHSNGSSGATPSPSLIRPGNLLATWKTLDSAMS